MSADGAFFVSAALANYPCECGDTMTQLNKEVNHIYTVELRFTGNTLEPIEISTRLNLQASNEFSQSQNQSTQRRRRPYWAYNGHGLVGFQPEWLRLEDGLEFLLKNLGDRKAEIITLACQYDGLWRCGHFQTSFDGGPTLSPELLIELGNYGIPLSIDNYFSDVTGS